MTTDEQELRAAANGYDAAEVRSARMPATVRYGISVEEAHRLLKFIEDAPASAARAKKLDAIRNRIGRK